MIRRLYREEWNILGEVGREALLKNPVPPFKHTGRVVVIKEPLWYYLIRKMEQLLAG